MALRNGHGNGAGTPRVEVLPPDELPAGTPAPARPAAARDGSGKFIEGAGTTELAREGARARHESAQLARLLGLWTPPEGHEAYPYHSLARDWRDAHMAQLAATVGGGSVGPGPASLVASAALALGASRYCYDLGYRTGDASLLRDAGQHADRSKQALLAAHELCAREAKARPKTASNTPWMVDCEADK